MIRRPSLLTMMAAAAGVAALANGVSAASIEPDAAPTRLGNAIDQELGARDQAAIRRKRALDLREQAARATEARIQKQLDGQPPAQQQQASQRGGPPVADASDQYDDLARIYQAMKPDKAAAVFEQLDLGVQMRIAQKMRERSTALILAAMTPRGAALLSMSLARRTPLRPSPPPPPPPITRR